MPNSKSRRYGARTRKRFGTIFSKKNEKKYHLSSSYVFCIAPLLWHLNKTCSHLIYASMSQKSLNLIKKWKKCWKLFDDRYVFGDGLFYLRTFYEPNEII